MRTRLVIRDGKVVELKGEELKREPSQQVFSIGGRSGFKWKKESANKTWIENGNIVKERKGGKVYNK